MRLDDLTTGSPDDPSRLVRLFEKSCQLLGRPSAPPSSIAFYPYAGLRHTIRLREGRILIRLSDILQAAPDAVLGALITILLCKLWNRPAPRLLRRLYRDYVSQDEIREAWKDVRRRRGRKNLTSPQGWCYDLREIFRELNREHFQDEVGLETISWSRRPNRRVLGHYDEAHRTIVIDRRLDDPSIPRFVVEYVVFHEMLHAVLGVDVQNGRCRVHPPHFRRAERAFPRYEEARRFIRSRL